MSARTMRRQCVRMHGMYEQAQGTTCEGINTHAGCSCVHGPRCEYLHMAGHLHTCNALARQAHEEQVRTP
eukprot:8714360-Alexandrium_andersonii.AAC.1